MIVSFSNLSNLFLPTLSVFLLLSTILPDHVQILPIAVVEAKESSGDALLTGTNSEFLLTKFAISPRTVGQFDLKLTIPTDTGMYTDERALRVHLFVDEGWYDKAQKATTCREKVKHATQALPVSFELKSNPLNRRTSKNKQSEEFVWEANIRTTLNSKGSDMTQYWYISLDDCTLEETYHDIKDAPKISFQYTIKNGDSRGPGYGLSHFSADENGMVRLHFLQLAFSSLLLIWCAYKIGCAITSSRGQIHIALLIVASALLCDISSNISELIHNKVYSMNGVGSYAFDAFASHFEAQCDAMVAIVLLLVGSGWTLPSDVIVGDANNNMAMLGTHSMVQQLVVGLRNPGLAMQQIKSGNPAAILVVSTLAFHAILAQWGRIYDDDFDCYHSLEHKPGYFLQGYRLILGVAFLASVASVRNSGRCPRALKPFLTKFMLVGISWFISLPFVATFVSTSIPYYLKHRALSIGAAMTQASSLASLVWLFTADSDASAYHRLSKTQEGNASLVSTSISSSNSVSKAPSTFWKFGKTKIRLD